MTDFISLKFKKFVLHNLLYNIYFIFFNNARFFLRYELAIKCVS